MGKKELLQTLGDFTSKENWDNFFNIRGKGDAFEWYAEWEELRDPLLSNISNLIQVPNPQILVPGCGNSRISEHLYDAGYHCITNIDFSKVVISDMLSRNVRDRADMRWRVMDMTSMQFMDDSFDGVLDKGGLDALMEPEVGPKLGYQYLSEVQRVTRTGGKFICLTLAESHVLGLLFSKFRFGWKMSVHAIPQRPSKKPAFQTFMVVAEKEESNFLHQIISSFNNSSLACSGNQVSGLYEALEKENRIRGDYSNGSDIMYSLEDLKLGAKGEINKLQQGQRLKLILGGEGASLFSYRAVLLDAREQPDPFLYHCGVFIVPQTRSHEWLFTSEEGQWMVVESSKAARLIMILLDKGHSTASMDDIQKDLSPLVKQLAPGTDNDGAQIPFMMASDGIKHRDIVHQVTSPLSGPVIVEDVVYENPSGDASSILPSRDLKFRRLIFRRTEGLVQSEALLTRDGSPDKSVDETAKKKARSGSKSKNRGTQKKTSAKPSEQLKVYHSYLASSYHTGIISGFMLISPYMESRASAGKTVNAVVIGLGAGLLPMFLHACMRFLLIEVVELDPVIPTLARDYFDFSEDKRLKVHIADGIQFVKEAKYSSTDATSGSNGNPHLSNVNCNYEDSRGTSKIDILIIDVDSSDSSSGMTCPAPDFVESPFLQTVKDNLSEQGLFVVNLVSRSPAVNDMVVLRMKEVFGQLFSLQLEEDVNEVFFALSSSSGIKEDCFPQAALQLEKLLELKHSEISQSILDSTKKIRCLK